MTLAVAACKTNAQDAANVAAATAAGQASGYASGNAAGTATTQASAVKAANFMISLESANPSAGYTMVKFGKDNANYIVLSYGSGSGTTYAAIDISAYVTGTAAFTYITSGVGVYDRLTANGNGTYSCVAGTCNGVSGPTSSTMV